MKTAPEAVNKYPMLVLGIRYIVSLVFIYAGLQKVIEPDLFLEDISTFQLTPYELSYVTAFFLPWLEIVAGLCLLINRAYIGGLGILTMLCLVFLVVLSLSWYRGLDVSCGCFGHTENNETNYPLHIGADLLLTSSLLFLIYCRRDQSTDKNELESEIKT